MHMISNHLKHWWHVFNAFCWLCTGVRRSNTGTQHSKKKRSTLFLHIQLETEVDSSMIWEKRGGFVKKNNGQLRRIHQLSFKWKNMEDFQRGCFLIFCLACNQIHSWKTIEDYAFQDMEIVEAETKKSNQFHALEIVVDLCAAGYCGGYYSTEPRIFGTGKTLEAENIGTGKTLEAVIIG